MTFILFTRLGFILFLALAIFFPIANTTLGWGMVDSNNQPIIMNFLVLSTIVLVFLDQNARRMRLGERVKCDLNKNYASYHVIYNALGGPVTDIWLHKIPNCNQSTLGVKESQLPQLRLLLAKMQMDNIHSAPCIMNFISGKQVSVIKLENDASLWEKLEKAGFRKSGQQEKAYPHYEWIHLTNTQ